MALGGGTFVSQNKVLPGNYINFVSAKRATATLSERGTVAMPIMLDWGVDGAVFTVTSGDFMKETMKYFGYAYDHESMKGLRDLFKNVKKVHFYRLIKGGAEASNKYGTAKYKGIRGNDIKTVIKANVDDATKMDVATYLGANLVDLQTVAPNTDNLVANDYVTWKAGVALEATAGLAMTGGTNGTGATALELSEALGALESYQFNIIALASTNFSMNALVVAFAERLRSELGIKCQAVIYNSSNVDDEGVVSVKNAVDDDTFDESALVYWAAGALAGCNINKSLTNKVYNGEFAVNANFKQSEIEEALRDGMFTFHRVGDEIRVVEDINTLVTYTQEKSEDFSSNQTVRVLDQIANDIATIFNDKYLGKIPNDSDGRVSLWNDVVKHHQSLQTLRAIENFSSKDVTVEQGETKKSVVITDAVTPVNAMAQLYMTVIVD